MLVDDPLVADFFEQAVNAGQDLPAKAIANWISGELFSLLKQSGESISQIKVTPVMLAELVAKVEQGDS